MSNKIETIYHYCSVETFMAIIQNKTLRLSDLNKTNDYMEKKWANRLIIAALQEALREYEIDMNLEEEYWYDDEADNHLQYFAKEVKQVLYDERPILITCFSREKDQLSQWRAYGQDGAGIAIGMNYKLIESLNNKIDGLYVEKVVYKEKNQQQRLEGLIESCIYYMDKLYKTVVGKRYKDYNEFFVEEFDAFCETLTDYVGQVACTIKNPAFAEEKEIRVIYNPELQDVEVTGDMEFEAAKKYFTTISEVDEYKIFPLNFSYKNNQLIAFCDLDFSKLIDKGIINEVVIGPKSNIKENDMYYLLMRNGINANNIKVSKSSATYR